MAVTKSEPGDANHPADHYLFVPDPAKSSTWKLRVKNARGDYDRALCGAVFAALTSNYRGQPADVPDKPGLLRKLKAIYDRQGWDWPGSAKNSAQDPASTDAVTFTADFDGPATADASMVVRTGKLFQAGDYPDKSFSMTPEEMQRAVESFTDPVELDLEHVDTVLQGKLGTVARIWTDGTSLMGDVALPAWLDGLLTDGERKVSAEWDRATKTLRRLALVRNPRVPDAALMAAFSADVAAHAASQTADEEMRRFLRDLAAALGPSTELLTREPPDFQALWDGLATFADRSRHPTGKYAREDSPTGQAAMQMIHDITAEHGARQRKKAASTASMASTHEARGFQIIHDTAASHGASHGAACTPASMSTTSSPARRGRMNLKEFLTGKAQEEGVQIDDLEAAFSAPAAPDLSAVDTRLAEKDAEIAALKAAQDAQAAEAARFSVEMARMAAERLHAEAVSFAQGLVAAHRITPAAAETLVPLAERIFAADSTATFADGVKPTATLMSEFVASLPDLSVFTTSQIASDQAQALFAQLKTPGLDGTEPAPSDERIAALLEQYPSGKALAASLKNGTKG
jgi:hypothetical protein